MTRHEMKKTFIAMIARHREEVEAFADEVRTTLLLPYFKKRGWTYVSGNGTWFVDNKHGIPMPDSELPMWLADLLWMEVAHGDYLGYYIVRITKEDLS